MNRSLTLLFFLGLALALASCSVVLDFTECESDADCVGVAAPGETLACVKNVCTASAECQTDQDCTSKAPRTSCSANHCVEPNLDVVEDSEVTDTVEETMEDLVDPDAPQTCTAHSECPDGFVCDPNGVCASATTEECPRAVFPDGDRDRVVFVGSILPTSPPFDEIGIPLEQSVQLAIEDFNRAGGLPRGRKIGWIACDSKGASTVAQAAANHLVHTMGVPAIIGPVFSTPFIDVTTSITAPNDVLTLSPTATSPAITGLDDSGLAWRVIASDVFQANAIVDRITNIAPTKVVVLAKNDAYGDGLIAPISAALTAALGEANVHLSNYEDPAKLPDISAIIDEFSAKVSAAIGAMPDADLVVLIGTTEAIDLFKIYLQGLQSVGIPPGAPPQFLFSHGAVPALDRAVSETADTMIAFVEGVSPNIFDVDNYAAFNLRYRARFANQDPITTTSLTYDATFVVLFAASAIERDMPVTGTGLIDGIAHLVDKSGTVVSFGASDFISTARNALAAGRSVDLKGVSGELDFDLATGDIRSDYIGWGIEKVAGNHVLKALRTYILNPAPAQDGTWFDIP